ncbi:unnamed protein product [Parascedosporium putredinis]|uniref:NAD(P)-binding domain-containing protein n=1 Tax=Parascedosporium putredinis TaxID=1442378 RepID=A0A9P1MFN5_9PEZI|nr:unnamed protein product [Parascedosporium putredinis]CAI8002795.1 unnamed protein product [Parascedosporium putredinis]
MVFLKNVAIVGATGTVGKFIASELVHSNQHTVTALTRDATAPGLPTGVHAVAVDYADPSTLVAALQGIDVLIITMASTAPRDTQAKLIEAAASAGVKYVVPNGWGVDASHPAAAETLIGPLLAGAQELTEARGMGWITFTSGFWYEFSLAGKRNWFGFDIEERSVVLFDDGRTKVNTSTWAQTGRAVAAVLAQDEAALAAKYRNKNVYFSSFYVSQRDMLDSLLRVTGTQESDWKIEYEPSAERFAKAIAIVKTGDFSAFERALYSRWFFPEAEGVGASAWQAHHTLANEELGLPQEDLDERTKYTVDHQKELMGKYGRPRHERTEPVRSIVP